MYAITTSSPVLVPLLVTLTLNGAVGVAPALVLVKAGQDIFSISGTHRQYVVDGMRWRLRNQNQQREKGRVVEGTPP